MIFKPEPLMDHQNGPDSNKLEFSNRHVIAQSLLNYVAKKKENLKKMEKVAKRLEEKGLSPEDFKSLMGYHQEEILHYLVRNGATAHSHDIAVARRAIEKENNNGR